MNLHPCGQHGSVSDRLSRLPGGQEARALGAGAAAGIPRALSAAWRVSQAGAEGGRAVRGSVPGFRGERDWSLLVGTPSRRRWVSVGNPGYDMLLLVLLIPQNVNPRISYTSFLTYLSCRYNLREVHWTQNAKVIVKRAGLVKDKQTLWAQCPDGWSFC